MQKEMESISCGSIGLPRNYGHHPWCVDELLNGENARGDSHSAFREYLIEEKLHEARATAPPEYIVKVKLRETRVAIPSDNTM